MTFEEIFNEDGLYTSDGFWDGFCFKVKNGGLYLAEHANKNDFDPITKPAFLHKSLFGKTYTNVLTRQSLF